MRSASMGADSRRRHRRESARADDEEDTVGSESHPENVETARTRSLREDPRRISQAHRPSGLATAAALALDGAESELGSGSGRSSATRYQRAGYAQTGGGGGAAAVGERRGSHRHQAGSSSSFSGTGGGASAEHNADSSSVVGGGSWGRSGSGGGRRHSGSRPENRLDEDDFLPFAMERSDFNMAGKPDDPGGGQQ